MATVLLLVLAWPLVDRPAGGIGGGVESLQRRNFCGPCSLCLACRVLGIDATIDEIAALADAGHRGVSIAGLVRAARKKGLTAEAYHSSMRQLRELRYLAIVDAPSGHFALFVGWEKGEIVIYDLPRGRRTVTPESFSAMWGRHLIVLRRDR